MNTVVYYPHIYPPPEWLRVAALCWDKVYRLTPPAWNDDPGNIKDLNNALGGILVDLDLKKTAEDQEVQRQFEQWIVARGEKLKTGAQRTVAGSLSQALEQAGPTIVSGKLANSSEASVEDKAVGDIFTPIYHGKWTEGGFIDRLLKKHDLIWEENNVIEARIPDWEKETYLENKIPMERPARATPPPKPGSAHEKYQELLEETWKKKRAGDSRGEKEFYQKAEQLRQKHLITVRETQRVMHLPDDVALYYLSLCASKAALGGERDLVAGGERFTDVVFHDFKTIQGEVAAAVLQAYLPENFLTMEPERLKDFRAEFGTQRFKYEQAVQALVNEFAEVASEGQLDVLKKNVIEIAKERTEAIKRTYTNANVGIATSTLGITLTPPALVSFIASLLGVGIFAPAGIAAALSLFAARSFLDWEKARLEKTKSPWSYVLDVAKL